MDSDSDITSALEIAKCGANLVSDRKADFSRNLGYALADFYGHYSSRDLHMIRRFNDSFGLYVYRTGLYLAAT